MPHIKYPASDASNTTDHARSTIESVSSSSGTPGSIAHSFQGVFSRVQSRSSRMSRLQVSPQAHAMAFLY